MDQEQSPRALVDYRAGFASSWSDEEPVEAVRFVVLDCESTGLHPERDRIVSIGAVAVQDTQILLDDIFEALLRVTHNTAATVVHGITRNEARSGMAEREALLGLLDYLRDGVIVGHHIGYDLAMLNAACRRQLGIEVANRHLDTMGLTLQLERDGAFAGQSPITGFSLDALCDRFGILPYDRHTAPGDAFLTAQIFLRLVRIARRHGRTALAALTQPFEPDRSME